MGTHTSFNSTLRMLMYVCGGIFFSLLYFGSRWRLEMFPKQKVDLKLWTFQGSLSMLYHTVSFFLSTSLNALFDLMNQLLSRTQTQWLLKSVFFFKNFTLQNNITLERIWSSFPHTHACVFQLSVIKLIRGI